MRILATDFMFSRFFGVARNQETEKHASPESARSSKPSVALDLPVVEARNRELLYKHAKTHIERTKIGEVEVYRRPFTQQVRSDFRALYPVLIPFFDQADKTSDDVVMTGFKMRCVTFALFLVYVGFAVYGLLQFFKENSHDSLIGYLSEFWLILPPLVAVPLVLLIRHSQIGEIKTKAGDFGGSFNGALHLLNNKANFALERVSDDEPTSAGCEQRAEEWTSIALWLFNLHNIYDRYVTTRSWIVQTRLEHITYVFRALKLAVIAVVTFIFIKNTTLSEAHSLPAFGAFLVYYVAGLAVWDILPGGGASNSIFADSFIGSISGRNREEIFENHVNTKTARLVKKLRGLYYNALKAH